MVGMVVMVVMASGAGWAWRVSGCSNSRGDGDGGGRRGDEGGVGPDGLKFFPELLFSVL